MINFIICDDDKNCRLKIEKIITNKMLKNNIGYTTHEFNDYNKEFYNIVKEKLPNKIYIMDIEMPSDSGINVARRIRDVDLNSIIIFITVHNDLASLLIYDEIMFLTFINKYNNFEGRISNIIDKCLKIVGKDEIISFSYNGTDYQIPIRDILYITNSELHNKAKIVTEYDEFTTNMNLKELSHILRKDVIRTHRKCYINQSNVLSISGNTIKFKGGIVTNLLSNEYKRRINGKH